MKRKKIIKKLQALGFEVLGCGVIRFNGALIEGVDRLGYIGELDTRDIEQAIKEQTK